MIKYYINSQHNRIKLKSKYKYSKYCKEPKKSVLIINDNLLMKLKMTKVYTRYWKLSV